VSGRERPLATVPGWLWALLGATLAAQLGAQALRPPPAAAASDLPPAPRAAALRAASLGEPAAAARLAMLYVQAFDLGAGNALPYRRLDYGRLRAWLRAILDTDPRSSYPLFAAARVYAEVDDPARARRRDARRSRPAGRRGWRLAPGAAPLAPPARDGVSRAQGAAQLRHRHH